MKLVIAIAAAAVVGLILLIAVGMRGDDPPAPRSQQAERSGDEPAKGTGPVRAGATEGAARPAEIDDRQPPEDDGREPVNTEPFEPSTYPHLAPEIKNNTATAKPMKAADRALRNGDFPVALEHAEEALRLDPTKNRARVIAVLAACGLSDGKLAQRHANQLDPMRYERVATKCRAQGVTLEGK